MAYVHGDTNKGWGVVRPNPWHFAGIFPTRTAAEAEAHKLGPAYIVRLGENQAGTDNFVWIGAANPNA